MKEELTLVTWIIDERGTDTGNLDREDANENPMLAIDSCVEYHTLQYLWMEWRWL